MLKLDGYGMKVIFLCSLSYVCDAVSSTSAEIRATLAHHCDAQDLNMSRADRQPGQRAMSDSRNDGAASDCRLRWLVSVAHPALARVGLCFDILPNLIPTTLRMCTVVSVGSSAQLLLVSPSRPLWVSSAIRAIPERRGLSRTGSSARCRLSAPEH